MSRFLLIYNNIMQFYPSKLMMPIQAKWYGLYECQDDVEPIFVLKNKDKPSINEFSKYVSVKQNHIYQISEVFIADRRNKSRFINKE